ncbi:hypothetical protein OG836_04005 [Micromonospora zamorensis]|uniref:hypothetical protein n=1 Tax=Micromonospora zamorensis TaxID=709883 RepID=UPI0018EC6F6B|nr:hypothetical protein [Micromonospora zamorensis]
MGIEGTFRDSVSEDGVVLVGLGGCGLDQTGAFTELLLGGAELAYGTHDGGLLGAGGESLGFADLPGLQVFDIEEDAGCFTNVLPRVRIIDLESFDPERFL